MAPKKEDEYNKIWKCSKLQERAHGKQMTYPILITGTVAHRAETIPDIRNCVRNLQVRHECDAIFKEGISDFAECTQGLRFCQHGTNTRIQMRKEKEYAKTTIDLYLMRGSSAATKNPNVTEQLRFRIPSCAILTIPSAPSVIADSFTHRTVAELHRMAPICSKQVNKDPERNPIVTAAFQIHKQGELTSRGLVWDSLQKLLDENLTKSS